MPTLLIFHEVDDVDHWLASPRREEFFGPLGITARTFVDPANGGYVHAPSLVHARTAAIFWSYVAVTSTPHCPVS